MLIFANMTNINMMMIMMVIMTTLLLGKLSLRFFFFFFFFFAFGVGVTAFGCLGLVAVFVVTVRITDINQMLGKDDLPIVPFQIQVRK